MNSLVHKAGCSHFSDLLLPSLSVKRNTKKSHAIVIRRMRVKGPWNRELWGLTSFLMGGQRGQVTGLP